MTILPWFPSCLVCGMLKQFLIESPKDTGDDRVSFLIRSNGTVLPGFVARKSLRAVGGLPSNHIVALYTEHRPRIAEAVKRKLAQGKLMPYIVISQEDLEAAAPTAPTAATATSAT